MANVSTNDYGHDLLQLCLSLDSHSRRVMRCSFCGWGCDAHASAKMHKARFRPPGRILPLLLPALTCIASRPLN